MRKNKTFEIAISLIPGVGPVSAKKLIAYCGGAEAVFKEKKAALLKIPGLGPKMVDLIQSTEIQRLVEAEIEFMEKAGVHAHYFLDSDYPQRLLNCDDGPIILYSKGKINWNPEKMISIVGTRKSSREGEAICSQIIKDLAVFKPTIVSGLAYGIDICAHRTCIENDIPTIGVLGGGLDKVYPSLHKKYSMKMMSNGGLATDFRSNTKMVKMNFVSRNRIVAGLSDAIIVIESPEKGGSLITAEMGNGYNRDVFAVPGRPGDKMSKGCNKLIQQNKAALLMSSKDIELALAWETDKKSSHKKLLQTELFASLNAEEECLIKAFKGRTKIGLDELSLLSSLTISKTNSLLFQLEFKGLVRSLPGKIYERI